MFKSHVVAHVCNPCTEERQKIFNEFEARLVYQVRLSQIELHRGNLYK